MLVPVFFLVGFKGGQGLSLSFSLVALLFFNKSVRERAVRGHALKRAWATHHIVCNERAARVTPVKALAVSPPRPTHAHAPSGSLPRDTCQRYGRWPRHTQTAGCGREGSRHRLCPAVTHTTADEETTPCRRVHTRDWSSSPSPSCSQCTCS